MINKKLLVELALYQTEAIKRMKCAIKEYSKLDFGIEDIYDKVTGGIYLYDIDTILLNESEKQHPIFKIFDIQCIENHRLYTCNLNDKVILRGPNNYYYGYCYLGDLDVENEQIIKTLEEGRNFILKSQKELNRKKFYYNNALDLKCVLAVLDVIRNSVITNLFFLLMKENEINDIYIYENGTNTLANELYKLLEKVELKFIDIILDQKQELINNVNEIILDFLFLQQNLINEIKENKQNYNNDLYIRYRKAREADNVIENIICLQYAIKSIEKVKFKQLNEKIYVLGLNYGSIELAIIANILLDRNGINTTVGNIMKKFRKVYVESTNNQDNIVNLNIENNSSYILIDENVMTGKTLQNAGKYLSENNMKLLDIISIKYPTIERIKNLTDINIDGYMKLLNSIKGMLFATNYSKLCEYRENFIFPYMDLLGTFDLQKYEILKNLYKNGKYIKNSAVARVGNYYKNIFI